MIKWFYFTHKLDPNRGTNTLGQSGLGSNKNERVVYISQNWSLTIRCNLVSYAEHLLVSILPLTEMLSMYFTVSAELNWVIKTS